MQLTKVCCIFNIGDFKCQRTKKLDFLLIWNFEKS